MGKLLHNGCGQTLRETVGSCRYSDTPQEALSNLIHLWSEPCLEQGLDQRPPAMPPIPNSSESGSWSVHPPLQSQKALPRLPGQHWDGGCTSGKAKDGERWVEGRWQPCCTYPKYRCVLCFWCCQAEQPLVQFIAGVWGNDIQEFVQIMRMLGSCSDT